MTPRAEEATRIPGTAVGRTRLRLPTPSRGPVLAVIAAYLFFAILTSPLLGTDAVTYYAAGERLNAGHQLYALGPGDRPVLLAPPYWTVPLLSPPLIAVVFRPLALLPIQLAVGIWVAVQLIGIAVVIAMAARDSARAAALIPLSLGLGLAGVIGNVNGLLLIGYVVVWRNRDNPWIGALIAVMFSLKIMPGVLVGLILARRDRRQMATFALGFAVALAVTIAGAGADSLIAYADVLRTSAPQPGSVAAMLGQHWISPLMLVAGTLGAALLSEVRSYRLALWAIVFGAPGLGLASSSQLLPALVPSTTSWRSAALVGISSLLVVALWIAGL